MRLYDDIHIYTAAEAYEIVKTPMYWWEIDPDKLDDPQLSCRKPELSSGNLNMQDDIND